MKKPLTVGTLKPVNSRKYVNKESRKLKESNPKREEKSTGNNPNQICFNHKGQNFCVSPPKDGSTLLDTALQQGKPVDYKCKKGKCGKCIVQLENPFDQVNNPTNQEKKLLEDKLSQGHRLACQTLLS